MVVIEDNHPETEYIVCPHLTADEEGWIIAASDGISRKLVDNEQSCVVLLLCCICSDVVKSGILDEMISRSITNSVRHFGLK